MEISFEIKKRQVYTILGFVFLFSIIIFVSAVAYDHNYVYTPSDFWGHEGDEVIITSTTREQKSLQKAIVDGDFNGKPLSDFKPDEILTFQYTGTNSPQTESIINDPAVRSCLLLKYAEKDVIKVATCSIYQSGTEWKIDIENADCGVVCLKWNTNKYQP